MLTDPGRDCTEPMKDNKSCYKCGQPGHISRDCPMGGAPGGGAGGSTECYKVGNHQPYMNVHMDEANPAIQCGEMGHIARNCPKSGFGNSYGGGGAAGGYGGGAGKTCYSCGGYGHMSRMCLDYVQLVIPTNNANREQANVLMA